PRKGRGNPPSGGHLKGAASGKSTQKLGSARVLEAESFVGGLRRARTYPYIQHSQTLNLRVSEPSPTTAHHAKSATHITRDSHPRPHAKPNPGPSLIQRCYTAAPPTGEKTEGGRIWQR